MRRDDHGITDRQARELLASADARRPVLIARKRSTCYPTERSLTQPQPSHEPGQLIVAP